MSLNTQDHDIYAQVLLEAYYAYHKDGKQQANSTMLCVVTDGTTWHLFTTNFNCRPLAFRSCFSVTMSSYVPSAAHLWIMLKMLQKERINEHVMYVMMLHCFGIEYHFMILFFLRLLQLIS